jgi:DNA-binding Lrp family transcriptional regulator
VSPPRAPDPIDLQVLSSLVTDPRMSVSQVAERVGIARNTAQARLDRLHDRGVLGRSDRGLDLAGLGLTVTANIAVEVEHAQISSAVQALAGIPFVLLVEEVAGPSGDLLLRVASRSNEHLQEVVHAVLSCPGVRRTITSVVLATHVLYRVQPLLEHLAAESNGEGRPDGAEVS